jgi:hypothetical protein
LLEELRVSKNRVVRKIYGPKREEVTGEWRKLHNEEFNDLYSSPNAVWMIKSEMRLGENCSTYGQRRGAYRFLVGRSDGTRLLVIPNSRYEDNIKMVLFEGWKGMD